MFRCCFAAQECDAALFLFEKLFDSFQFILSRTKADLFRLIKGCLPFNIRVGIFKMIVVAVPSRLCKVLAKLTVFNRSCLQAGIGTRLVKSNRVEACKHSDIRQDRSIVLPMTVTVRADILYQRDMEARTSIADSLRILRHFPVEARLHCCLDCKPHQNCRHRCSGRSLCIYHSQ